MSTPSITSFFKRRRKKRKKEKEDVASSDDDSLDSDTQDIRHKDAKRQGDSCDVSLEKSDPHDLMIRFVENHETYFPQALREIKQGGKRSHWLWFIFPTPPYIVYGVERGSETNRYYALRGDAPKAYLEVESLRSNYVEICRAMECQVKFGNSLKNIFGPFDLPKVISSLKLFRDTAVQVGDNEVASLCGSLLSMEDAKSGKSKSRK